jgi:hypothetical protein
MTDDGRASPARAWLFRPQIQGHRDNDPPVKTMSEVTRGTVNANLRANWRSYAAAPRTWPAIRPSARTGAELNTTYYPDKVHPSDARNVIIGTYLTKAVNSLW